MHAKRRSPISTAKRPTDEKLEKTKRRRTHCWDLIILSEYVTFTAESNMNLGLMTSKKINVMTIPSTNANQE